MTAQDDENHVRQVAAETYDAEKLGLATHRAGVRAGIAKGRELQKAEINVELVELRAYKMGFRPTEIVGVFFESEITDEQFQHYVEEARKNGGPAYFNPPVGVEKMQTNDEAAKPDLSPEDVEEAAKIARFFQALFADSVPIGKYEDVARQAMMRGRERQQADIVKLINDNADNLAEFALDKPSAIRLVAYVVGLIRPPQKFWGYAHGGDFTKYTGRYPSWDEAHAAAKALYPDGRFTIGRV